MRLQLDPGHATGTWTLWSSMMNTLHLIQERQQRQNRRYEAQFLQTKTYRGIQYTSAHQSPVALKKAKEHSAPGMHSERACIYRGLPYNC